MKKTIFTGAAVAIVTPMFKDGSINYEKLGELIDWQIENSTDAIVICGTTGESACFTDQEHIDCIEFAVKRTAGRVPVIAGAGSNDTRYALDLCIESKRLGADALLQVTPYYNKTSQRGLIAHFTKLADATDLPTILYNVPSRTGVNIAPATYAELAKHPNIVATKEASGNLSQVAQIKALCGDDLDIYSGNDDQVLPIMSLGGKGVISVLSNVMPKETHDMCAAYLNGDKEKAAQMQLRYLDLINHLFMDVNPIPVKEALNLMGWDVGECRLPLVSMEEAQVRKLAASMKAAGLLK